VPFITQALSVVAVSLSYWCAAQLDATRVRLALHCLEQFGFRTYAPRLRQHRVSRGRKIETTPLLFTSYVFVFIVDHWWVAHRTPGVIRLVRDGDCPARVPDVIIAELKQRERNGLIELTEPPPRFKPGDPVKVTSGAFAGHLALYDGQTPHERVAVLLALLGGRVRVELPEAGIEPVRANIEAVQP
jgi:transcriptional antiterminator RfaH